MKTNTLNVHDNHLGLFETQSFTQVDFANPTAEMIDAIDIAHALAHICRFGGHTYTFYSVAEHSILVAALAPKHLKKAALLHDAAEAYIGDVIKPLKNLLGEPYAEIERAFERAIAVKFNVPLADFEAVKPYDKRALELEHSAYKIMCNSSQDRIEAWIRKELSIAYNTYDYDRHFLKLLERYEAS